MEDGETRVTKKLKLCCTIDHRFLDGAQVSPPPQLFSRSLPWCHVLMVVLIVMVACGVDRAEQWPRCCAMSSTTRPCSTRSDRHAQVFGPNMKKKTFGFDTRQKGEKIKKSRSRRR